jgi:hypothetical protein
MSEGGEFKVAVLQLDELLDARLYEEIKQDVCVDQTGRYEIVSESPHWDQKTGHRYVEIQYIDRGAQQLEERF